MKNKTIEILDVGEHILPTGTKIVTHFYGNSSKPQRQTCKSEFMRKIHESLQTRAGNYIQVDFSELPPLYPTKGMTVPEEGIEFAHDRGGRLVLVGEFGIGFMVSDYSDYSADGDELAKWDYVDKNKNFYELKRTLPKTITVCSECLKEVCECKYESGYYRIKICNDWTLRYYDKESGYFYQSSVKCENFKWGDGRSCEVDWANPINVIPEGNDA